MASECSSIQNYMEKMRLVHQNLLNYFDNPEASDSLCEDFINILKKQQIFENKNDFKVVIYLISNISNYHYRSTNSISKIENLLKRIKPEIQKEFNDVEIFGIFNNNKRILFFLLDEKILQLNNYIRKILKTKYFNHKYYEEYIFNQNDPNPESKRLGENESHICYLIRTDSIEFFIKYANQNSINLSNTIEPSIYETNPLLIGKKITLFL